MQAASKGPFAEVTLTNLHIDVARNASDDFNLFHDSRRWQQIENNPFGGPIALGFQLLQFIEHNCKLYRFEQCDDQIIEDNQLEYSNYQFNFANVVKPNQTVSVFVKPTKLKLDDANPHITNRVVVKADNKLSLIGFKSHSTKPLFGSHLPDLLSSKNLQDRRQIENTQCFYKRKFSTNSDAKNFLISAGIDQADYFDDLADVNNYSETYCSSLLSCALLERGKNLGLNFLKNPMVYTQHKISVNTKNVAKLRSAQLLHCFVDQVENDESTQQVTHDCWVLNQDFEVLVQSELSLAPLSSILE